MRLLKSMSAHRAIDPGSQLEPVAIGEDVILAFRFDRLELAVGEAGCLSAHEKYSMTPFGIPKIGVRESGIRLGIPSRRELEKSGKPP